MGLIKTKFKQTEVGLIPEDWNCYQISDLLKNNMIIGHLDGNHGSLYPKASEFVNFGVPYVTANDFVSGRVEFKNVRFVTPERASKFQKGLAKNGDVLFAHNATVGPTTVLQTDLEFVILSTTATYFRTDNEKLLNAYLRFFFESKSFVSQYFAVMRQSTRNQIPITAQRKFFIPIPSTLTEQKAIATALSDVDELIAKLEKLIEKKKAIKQGAMQALLNGKIRLNDFKTSLNNKQSKVGSIPDDWKLIPLKDCLSENLKYGIGAAAITFNTSYPTYLRITDIDENGTLIKNGLKSVNHFDAINYVIDEGEIVFARTGASVGKSYLYDPKDGKLVYAGFLIKARPNPSVLIPFYLKAYVSTNQYWKWVTAMSMRSGQPGINSVEYGTLPIPIPPNIEEQKAIAKIIIEMVTQIEMLEIKKNKLHLVKQGMMQELLTGRTRLV
jgi:type I restriction enzyme S subunit